MGTTPDDVLSDRVVRVVNGGQPGRGGRALLRSAPPLDRLFAAPYRMGLELARISLGETVIGGPLEEAGLG